MANVNKVIVGSEVKLNLSTDTVTADKLLKNITAHDKTGTLITGTYEDTAVETQEKSVTPAMTAQTVTPDEGKYLSKVTVAAIPVSYVDNEAGGQTLTIGG